MNTRTKLSSAAWLAIIFLALARVATVGAQTAVYTYDSSGNPTAVTLGATGPPTITAPPQAELIGPNSLATFSVSATGPGLSYQWLSNGVPILGATGDSLVLADLALLGTNLGNFSVIVSNAHGSITSAPAPLWTDVNGNGMPDWWEMKYFGNLNQTADGDYDGDGVSNLDEFLEGTDPTNPHSYHPRLHIQHANLGRVVASPDLPYYTMGQFVTLTAIPDSGQMFLGWSGAATGAKSSISLIMNSNSTVTANFGLPLGVALDNTNLAWTTGGSAPWFGQTEVSEDGLGAAQSGLIFAGQQSWLQAVTTNLIQTSELGFWWNVSSQSPTALAFSIDGSVEASIAGPAAAWQQVVTNLPAGVHTLVWTYSKESDDSPTGIPFSDSGWVDEVAITPTITRANAPLLSITLTNTNTLLISWPAAFTGFVLQQNHALVPANWSNVTNSVQEAGGQNEVTATLSTTNQFYRLILP
jgi:hypothetical protein